MHFYFTALAQRYGLHTAIIAQILWEAVCENERQAKDYHGGRCWTQQSIPDLSAALPYLSEHAINKALTCLRTRGLIIRDRLGRRQFDHSYWYAFTERGTSIMLEMEDIG